MTDLKKCPCGKTPEGLHIADGYTAKWAYVSGMCCNEWEIEFRTNYDALDSADCMESAITAWNGATRA